MRRSRQHLLRFILAIPLLLIGAALLYMVGMAQLEGKPRTFWQSLEWAAETISTTGYGADARWQHPVMVLLVVAAQLIGVFLAFAIIPIVVLPFLEERFQEKLPRRAPRNFRDHIVIFRYGAAVEMLLSRLSAEKVPAIVVERDESTARALHDRNVAVVVPTEDVDPLDVCNLESARAIVANGRDEENGPLVLRARHGGFKGEIYALVDEPVHRKPIEVAGATAVYTPRHILAAAIAARASETLVPRIHGLRRFPDLAAYEYRVRSGHEVTERDVAAQGLTVGGFWRHGRFVTTPHDAVRLERATLVLLVGPAQAFEQPALHESLTPMKRNGPFIVGGFGEVGGKVHQLLTDVGEEVVTIDRRQAVNVQFTGNVLDPTVLSVAGLDRARAVVLALDSDDATLFATMIVRDTSPEIPIIARVNHERNTDDLYRAGADFALSISEVSGQMLSHRLLGDRLVSMSTHLAITDIPGAMLSKVDSRTLTIVAVRRNGALLGPAATSPGEGDVVYVCGTDQAIRAITSS